MNMYLNSVLKNWVLGLAVALTLLVPPLGYSQGSRMASFKSYNYPDRYIRHRNALGYIEQIGDELGRKDATYRLVRGLAGRCTSFESINYPGQFLRHQNARLKLAMRTNEQLFKEDATFCIVPGLFGEGGVSFESFNFPGHYIRHKSSELWIDPSDGSDLFRKDATFIKTKPLYGD